MRAYNSTIRIKDKVCIRCGKVGPWFSRKRCAQCAKIEDVLAADEKEFEKVVAQEDLSSIIADLDAVFSQYIRLKDADSSGNVACYTCGNKKHWTLQQCGHFLSRSHLFLRWDERQCRVQDKECNEFKQGNTPVFRTNLERDHPGIVEILEEEVRTVYKPSKAELKQLISHYSTKVKELKKNILLK
jgi:hypothetical protein